MSSHQTQEIAIKAKERAEQDGLYVYVKSAKAKTTTKKTPTEETPKKKKSKDKQR
jgi:hypothetical protein